MKAATGWWQKATGRAWEAARCVGGSRSRKPEDGSLKLHGQRFAVDRVRRRQGRARKRHGRGRVGRSEEANVLSCGVVGIDCDAYGLAP